MIKRDLTPRFHSQNEDHDTPEEEVGSPDLAIPSDVPWLSHAFPFTFNIGPTAEGVRGSLIGLLPSATEAQRKADCYFEHAAWM